MGCGQSILLDTGDEQKSISWLLYHMFSRSHPLGFGPQGLDFGIVAGLLLFVLVLYVQWIVVLLNFELARNRASHGLGGKKTKETQS